ncbi:hypothetical protein ONZ45_g12749 [Pleurotus djamor]|nr:hypothetical protein ONZ45_g12749 [Pleurotus djamor]
MSATRLDLASEDATLPSTDVSGNVFLYRGLELEGLLRVIRDHSQDQSTSDTAALQERQNALARQITTWRRSQALAMPSIHVEHPPSLDPERIPLLLPSSFPPSPTLQILQGKESCLHLAQLHDSIIEIRRLLRIKASLREYKYSKADHSQSSQTRTQAVVNRFQGKIAVVADCYRATRKALLKLDPQGSWLGCYPELQNEDITFPKRQPTDQKNSREVSWIWRRLSSRDRPDTTASSDPETSEALRIEWMKSHARAQQWSEEVDLVVEEMRRVATYLNWNAAEWSHVYEKEVSDDLVAYLEW